MLRIRCFIFYILYNATGCWFGVTGWLIGWLPYSIRYRYIVLWNHVAVWLARVLVNMHVQLVGAENIPDMPCVVMSKHQSQFETFYLQTLFQPLNTILKKELLSIPFFGWGLARLEPIAIDRSNPKQALRQIQQEGLDRLKKERNVLIFPEGTRIPYGEKGNYARSGANLAIAAGVPVLPVAHNAGKLWPADQFMKTPGIITFSIGPLISSQGRNSRELTDEVEQWIERECERIRQS